MIRVFVSSVSKGLEAIRPQIQLDLRKAGYDVLGMEQFGAQAETPLDVCLRELRRATVVVLIIGPRYGSMLPQGISYTHAEFREARAAGIPVLAFRVPDAAGLRTQEQDRLSTFVTEVGSTTTYDQLSATESLDRLSPRILAALASAQNRGDLGSRFSLFLPYEKFFRHQLRDPTTMFNHAGPFLGRASELERLGEFIAGAEPVLFIKAPGGSGKSRLLLESAKAADGRPAGPKLLFVDAGAQWSADDIAQLPVTPTVLIFDDAHRRPDLDRLISACLRQNDQLRCIVSCRPSAVGIVKPMVAQLMLGDDPPLVELPALTKVDAEELARSYLGSEYAGLADRLVKLADRNPLVIRVGARCIAEKKVPPEVLERTPEIFRTVVLNRLLDDPGLAQPDAGLRRRILEAIATVGPVATESDEFTSKLTTLLGAPTHEVLPALAGLERGGFLVRRGRLVRVSPDVLADHLLYRAAVDELGRPTKFVEAMIEAFGPALLENILANAAELDWRVSATADAHEPVLAATWRDIMDLLPRLSNPQRVQLLGQLKRAALFAPDRVLAIAEWLTDNPDAPPDEQFAQWGLEDKPDRLRDPLSELFAFIAGDPDHTLRCVARLWMFAEHDERPTNPHPAHARRRLEDLLKYELRSDWQSPDGVQAKALHFLVQKLDDPTRTTESPWAIPILGTALHRLGEAHTATRREFTFGSFPLAPFLQHIAQRRKATIACLKRLALGPRPGEAAAALREIAELLRLPRGTLGKELGPDEIAPWEPEAKEAASLLGEVAGQTPSDAIRYAARRELREVSRERWPAVASAVEDALRNCPPVANELLYDLLAGLLWEEQLESYQDEQQRVKALCARAAGMLWSQEHTAERVLAALMAGIAALRSVGREQESHAGGIIRELISARPSEAEPLVRALVSAGEPGWRFLRPALVSLHDHNTEKALALIAELARAEPPLLRASAIDPLRFMLNQDGAAPAILDILRPLAGDPAPLVRQTVAQLLRHLSPSDHAQGLRLLASIDWADDPNVAAAVLDVLHPKYGLDPAALTDEELDSMLTRIVPLPALEGGAHDVLQFIAFASGRRPTQTVDLLLARIKAVDQHSGERFGKRWTPVPYNGHGLSLPGLSSTPDYRNLLRRIRDTALGASPLEQFWLPELFHVAVTDLTAGLDVLREWVASGDPAKITGAARLLRGFEHDLVFSIHEFIAALLEVASRCSPDCLSRTRSELFALAISGGYSATPGQPAPRHLRTKSEAQRLMAQYAASPAVSDFYRDLVQSAEHSIKRDVELWDEEGEDE